MRDDDGIYFFWAWVAVVVLVVVISLTAIIVTGRLNAKWQIECVKRGHAEWVVAEDGSTKWRWKE